VPGEPILLPCMHGSSGASEGGAVPSIARGLTATRTARWYQEARGSASWTDRQRCFDALSDILCEHRAPALPYVRPRQPPIEVPGLLSEVAHRAYFSSREPVYKRWRAAQDGRKAARWAGPDRGITPSVAFVCEAKIVSFWPYRAGMLDVAATFDMADAELLTVYLRTLTAWTRDHITLAACAPPGPPPCAAEDMDVFAAGDGARTACLAGLCRTVIDLVLEDPSITPLGAFNVVRAEVAGLYPESGRVADRVESSIAELSDRLMRDGNPGTLVDADQARLILAGLDELKSLLAGSVAQGAGTDGTR
jgi:hypothetical protein